MISQTDDFGGFPQQLPPSVSLPRERRIGFVISDQSDDGFVVTWTAIRDGQCLGRFGQMYDRFGNKFRDVFPVAAQDRLPSHLGDFVLFAGRKTAVASGK